MTSSEQTNELLASAAFVYWHALKYHFRIKPEAVWSSSNSLLGLCNALKSFFFHFHNASGKAQGGCFTKQCAPPHLLK